MPHVSSPDPCLSANIYCSGRLSEVIHKVIAPLWQELADTDDETSYLWLMRYARGGEHLKLRAHGGSAMEEAIRVSLPKALEAYFASLPLPDEGAERVTKPQATPIDVEDQESEDAPDRSFRWTQYQRSHVALGARPYMDHDAYVSALTRALASGTWLILQRLETQADGSISFGKVQGILLQVLIAGLGVAGFDDEMRAEYLRYHRDWLLRTALKYGGKGGTKSPRKLAETLTRFDGQVASLGAGAAAIEKAARSRWSASEVTDPSDPIRQFESRTAELLEISRPMAEEQRFHIDPFASHGIFPPLFRLLHGCANQLGVNALNEAFVHHLLFSVATDVEVKNQPVTLAPAL